ncbi:hypothetical protein ACFW8X_38085, partial [Streptomyces sp. NPDC058718]
MNRPSEQGESRRASNARKRISRRPSRLGIPAGTLTPDRAQQPDAGFPGLLKRTWQRAGEAGDLRAGIEVLLTLDGHVPADVQLRALGAKEEAALVALCGLTWRTEEGDGDDASLRSVCGLTWREEEDGGEDLAGVDQAGDDDPVFVGEVALATTGRIVLRVPAQEPLSRDGLAGGIWRVPWTSRTLETYRQELRRAEARLARSVADCRAWLAEQGPEGRDALLEQAT